MKSANDYETLKRLSKMNTYDYRAAIVAMKTRIEAQADEAEALKMLAFNPETNARFKRIIAFLNSAWAECEELLQSKLDVVKQG